MLSFLVRLSAASSQLTSHFLCPREHGCGSLPLKKLEQNFSVVVFGNILRAARVQFRLVHKAERSAANPANTGAAACR